jgi:Uma2 family endonuclease
MYAAAAIPQYLIINVRDDQVEVFHDPNPAACVYRARRVGRRGDRIELVPFPGSTIAVDEVLPALER